jgi:hypothetical protein
MSDYLGATEGELLSVSAGRRFLGYQNQQVLFPHRGPLRLEPQALVLGLDGEDPVYLLIDFRWFTGINQARRWAPVLQEWLARP